MDPQRLFTRLEVKNVDTSQRLIEGYAAAFLNRDRTGDVIEPKAFDRSIKENHDVVAFIGHDSSKLPVGEPISMRADANGLLTTTSIYATADGDALLEVARRRLSRGKTLGMSIGYRVAPGGSTMEKGVRHLTDVDLVEYSFLASPDFAANPLAQMTGVKAKKDSVLGQVITYDDSYEDLIDDLEDAAEEALGVMDVCVMATFPTHVVVCVMGPQMMGDEDSTYYDIPYQLDANKEPVLGTPVAVDQAYVPSKEATEKAAPSAGYDPGTSRPGASGRSDYAYIDSNGRGHLPIGDAAHVRAAMSRFDQTQFESDAKKTAAAKKIVARARSLNIEVSPDSAVAKAAGAGKSLTRQETKRMPQNTQPWDAAFVALLPDDAFAHIEGNGLSAKDDTGRTVPRAARHYAHHNHDGTIDAEHLAHALSHAQTVADGEDPIARDIAAKSVAHLGSHAYAEYHGIDSHAPEWSEGAAAALLIVGYKLDECVADIAKDRLAMERTGIDTKKGARLNSGMRSRLKELHNSLGQILEWADKVEKGEDGKMLVDMFRHRLALLQVDEV